MKEQTNRPRFNLVSAFIAMLGVQSMLSNKDNKETRSGLSYSGLGTFTGAPVYTPKRTKFKGYMRDVQYKAKHK